MDHRTHGIILRTRPLTETSLIVNWLTPDLGRVSTVAKGALRPKSPFRGKLDLFFTAEFSFVRSHRTELHTLREVVLLDSRPVFRRELPALHRGCYATAFVEQVTETETPIPELAEVFGGFIDTLSGRPGAIELVPAFELRMLNALGLGPNLTEASLTEGARKMAGHLARDNWADLAVLKLTPAQQKELHRFLHAFLLHHLGRVPRSRENAWETDPTL